MWKLSDLIFLNCLVKVTYDVKISDIMIDHDPYFMFSAWDWWKKLHITH